MCRFFPIFVFVKHDLLDKVASLVGFKCCTWDFFDESFFFFWSLKCFDAHLSPFFFSKYKIMDWWNWFSLVIKRKHVVLLMRENASLRIRQIKSLLVFDIESVDGVHYLIATYLSNSFFIFLSFYCCKTISL